MIATFATRSPDGIVRAYTDRGVRVFGPVPAGMDPIDIRPEAPMVDEVIRLNGADKTRRAR